MISPRLTYVGTILANFQCTPLLSFYHSLREFSFQTCPDSWRSKRIDLEALLIRVKYILLFRFDVLWRFETLIGTIFKTLKWPTSISDQIDHFSMTSNFFTPSDRTVFTWVYMY